METHLAADTIFRVGALPITNTLLASWLSVAVLAAFAYFATKRRQLVPHGVQNLAEIIVEQFLGLAQGVTGDRRRAVMFLPIVLTLFLFVLVNNWIQLVPGFNAFGFTETSTTESALSVKESAPTTDTHPVESSGTAESSLVAEETQSPKESTEEHEERFIPLFRGANSDLNVTLALALITVVLTQFFGIKEKGLKGWVGHYFHNPLSGGIVFVILGLGVGLFIGFLEVVSEFVKVVSLSFRLFGNIFAGETVLHTIGSLAAYVVPVPFMLLEVIVGVVQAAVFALLTLVFLSIITTPAQDQH